MQLNDDWRVVTDRLQWVLQRRQGDRWRDRSFCCTRPALLRCIREHCGAINTSLALPEWHPNRVAAVEVSRSLAPLPSEPLPGLLPASTPPDSAFQTNYREVLKGDDYQLDYYPDGYPKLPACLDRRRVTLAEAA